MSSIQKIIQNHKKYNTRDQIATNMTQQLAQQGFEVNKPLLNFFKLKAVERLAVCNKNIRKNNAMVPERMGHIYDGTITVPTQLEDIVDYYNTCLTEEQQHQIMVNFCVDEFKNPVEDVYGNLVPHINPYTEQPYCDNDVCFDDAFVSLFFAKLCDLNEQDRDKVIDMLRFSWTFNLDYMFDFNDIKNPMVALSKQLDPILDVCCVLSSKRVRWRDNATEGQRELVRQAYDKLWEAKILIDKVRKQ